MAEGGLDGHFSQGDELAVRLGRKSGLIKTLEIGLRGSQGSGYEKARVSGHHM